MTRMYTKEDQPRPRPNAHSSASLLRSQKYSDLTLRSREREFKVHKAIVCPQIPLLDQLCGDRVEKPTTLTIDPQDDPDVFQRILEYLYTGAYSGVCDEELSLFSPVAGPEVSYSATSYSTIRFEHRENLLALQSVPPWDDLEDQGGLDHISDSKYDEVSISDSIDSEYVSLERGRSFLGHPERPRIATRTPSRNLPKGLILDLRVYLMADKYRVAPLKEFASGRFMRKARRRWTNLETFPGIIDEIFTITPTGDDLREFICGLVASQYRDVMIRSWLRPVMQKHIDLALGVLDKTVAGDPEI